MRVYSVMPQLHGVNNAEKLQKQSASVNVQNSPNLSDAVFVSTVNMHPSQVLKNNDVVRVSFTGNPGKDINATASYAPENKRFKWADLDKGGLGVVSREAAESWRLLEKQDVRDFSPYHSYGNEDGGVRVVHLQRNPDGSLIRELDKEFFYNASATETLDEVAARSNLKKEDLAFVLQSKPDSAGKSKFLLMEDTGIKGTFDRVSDEEIDKTKEVQYRLFRSIETPDIVKEKEEKILNDIRNSITNKTKEDISKKVSKKYDAQLKAAETAKDTKKLESLQLKMNGEVSATLKSEKIASKIEKLYQEAINSKEVKEQIEAIRATSAAAVKERNSAYFVHTAGLAKLSTAYGADGSYGAYGTYGAYGAYSGNISTHTHYSDNCRAFAEILPLLNTEAHGNYNPANIWLHCRPAFFVMSAISDLSSNGKDYYNGLKVHSTFHNPGRNYQGVTNNPFEFFRMVATKQDVEEIAKHPQIRQLKDIEKRWGTNLTETERNFAQQILKPFMQGYVDDIGDYNVTMTPINAVKTNPKNMSAGTVSMNYDKEMKNPDTTEISEGLTKPLSEIKTISITNGSTPANLRLNDPNATFHRNGEEANLLTQNKAGFTTYEYKANYDKSGKLISSNIDEVLSAKEKNTQWLIDIIANATNSKEKDALGKVFFSDHQLKACNVIGGFSKYNKGDILLMGWGRPDSQKGYPSTLEAFKNFLMSDAPESVKQKTKLILGAGTWPEDDAEYIKIKQLMKEIAELDGGKYKGNTVYVNGFFPNRLVGCATFSIFSSRFEPCGITPLESFAAGTPVISTRTGGAPDFIARSRGYLTENPFLLNPEKLKTPLNRDMPGKTSDEIKKIIDEARIKQNADELSKCIQDAVYDYDEEYKKYIDQAIKDGKIDRKFERVDYKSMVEDAITQKVDWHENAAYNGGKSANQRYMEEVWERSKGFEGRDKNPLKRMVSKFGTALDANGNPIKEGVSKSKVGKILLGVGAGAAVIGTGVYVYMRNQKEKAAAQEPPIPVAKLDKKA